jgi:hypothetical protein
MMTDIAVLDEDYHIVIPEQMKHRLPIQAGQKFFVSCRHDCIVLVPKPNSFSEKLAGLHKEIWENTDDFIRQEREAWQK